MDKYDKYEKPLSWKKKNKNNKKGYIKKREPFETFYILPLNLSI